MWPFWLAFGTVTVLCFLAGLARARFLHAPAVATALVVGLYAAVLIAFGTWAGSCWECSTGYEDDRRFGFLIAMSVSGFMAAVSLGLIWIAAWVSTLIWRQPSLKGMPIAMGWVTFVIVAFGILMMVSE